MKLSKSKQTPKSNRGGRRAGSGSKPKLIGPTVRRVYLDEDTVAFLRKFGRENGKDNLSEGVRRAGAIAKTLDLAIKSGDRNIISAAHEESENLVRSFGQL